MTPYLRFETNQAFEVFASLQLKKTNNPAVIINMDSTHSLDKQDAVRYWTLVFNVWTCPLTGNVHLSIGNGK